MADLDLDALQALADAATPGPWVEQARALRTGDTLIGTPADYPVAAVHEARNAELICAARNALPALIARVRELEAALALAVGTTFARLSEDDLDALDDDERSGRRKLGGYPFTIADARKILAALGKEPRRG